LSGDRNSGFTLKGIVDALAQVAIDEQLLAQQDHEVGQVPTKGQLHVQDLDRLHGDQCRTVLCLRQGQLQILPLDEFASAFRQVTK